MTSDDLTELSLETLQREKEALSQQVKRLIRAEGKLYEYQQVLDNQLREYKALYELNKKLNATLALQDIFNQTVSYIVQDLEYERALILRHHEESHSYHVCAMEGYYDEDEKRGMAQLTVDQDGDALSDIVAGREFVVCKADCCSVPLVRFRDSLLMHDYLLFPIGTCRYPGALLAAGNSSANAAFYRVIDENRDSFLSLGNVVGLVSSIYGNRVYYEKMEKARELERVAEAKYRSIFENAIEGIFQRTPEGRYLDANRALAQMMGYGSAQEMIDEVASIRNDVYVDPGDHDELMRLLHETGYVEGYETRIYRKDRRMIWVSLTMRIVRDAAGKVLHYEGTSEEITERKRAEEALRDSEQRYRQLSEDLEQRVQEAVHELRQKDKILILQGRQAVMGEMISNIAHQWRQPLNMLALLVQDLQMTKKLEGLTDEFIDDNVARSLEIIRQMSKTIDYFRYFFKPDKEKVEFRVLETIEKTASILDGSLKMHGIRTEIAASCDPMVTGYPTEFVQVLLNILINARDALLNRKPSVPLIRVRLFAEGGKTVVTITDNAGGIPEEIVDRIFDPYFTTKGPEQGTGIGLFMCKTIIEKNMHGSLTVRNVGDGAEFRVEV